ncbi:CD109 antigen-like isoform X1 [Lampetra planeri]
MYYLAHDLHRANGGLVTFVVIIFSISLKMRLFLLLITATVAQSTTYLLTYPSQWMESDLNMGFSLLPGPGNETLVNVTFKSEPNGISKELNDVSAGTTTMMTFTREDLGMVQNNYWTWMSLMGKSGDQEIFSTSVGYYHNVDVNLIVLFANYYHAPGKTVRFSVFGVYRNKLPYLEPFNISLTNPNGVLMETWQNVREESGVVSLHYPLSAQATLGRWYIHVEAGSDNYNYYFYVENYDHVFIDVASYFYLDGNEDVSGFISAWYQGKAVEGTATVTIHPENNPADIITQHINLVGDGYFMFRRSELMKMIPEGTEDFYFLISVQITDNASGRRFESNHWIYFLKNRAYIYFYWNWRFIPGMDFTDKIYIYKYDGLPLTAEELETKLIVLVTQYNLSDAMMNPSDLQDKTEYLLQTELTYTVPPNGIVHIHVPTSHEANHLTIEVHFGAAMNSMSVWAEEHFQNYSIIQVRADETSVTVGSPVTFTVQSTDSSISEVSYQVAAMGNVLEVGVARLPQFSLTPSDAWGPATYVIAYYGTDDGYIINDGVELMVQEFVNMVDVKWSTQSAVPGENVNLEVTATDPESFVGVVAFQSYYFGRGMNMISDILSASALDSNPKWWHENMFSAAGLNYATNGQIKYWDSKKANKDHSRKLEKDRMRKSNGGLPEAWVWQPGVKGPNKKTTFTAVVPKVNSRWMGIAFSVSKTSGVTYAFTRTQFEVSSPLHVAINVPNVAILDEEFIVEVKVFNKQPEIIKVLATLHASETHFKVLYQTDGKSPYKRFLNVPKKESGTVSFPVSLLVAGEFCFTVVVSHNNINYTVVGCTLGKHSGFPQSYSESAMLKLSPEEVTKTFIFNFPPNVVKGSSSASFYIYGDIIGPSLTGLDQLLQMPYGCGEQNMINFAPGIYIRRYMEVTQQITQEIIEKSLTYMTSGYQQELNYRRYDGSFSAFGNSDQQGSTWLTAFVLRTLLQAQHYITVDVNVISEARTFLLNNLLSTGQFEERGYVIHKELQGGSASHISLTAYTLLAFLEDATTDSSTIAPAVHFLEANVSGGGVAASLPLALTTYALALANSSRASAALDLLNVHKKFTDDGLIYWSDSASGQASYYWQPTAITIETTAYALLAHLRLGKIADAIPIMNWLSQQRNHLGGYASTQDTIVALQALSEYSVYSFGTLEGKAKILTSERSVEVQLSGMNALDKHVEKIPTSSNINVKLSAFGKGTIIGQLNVFYNVRDAPGLRRARSAAPEYVLALDFNDTSASGTIGEKVYLTACAKWMGEGPSGMVLMEVNLLSGFHVADNLFTLNEILKLVEVSPGKVYLYFVNLNDSPTCVEITQYRVSSVAKAKEGVVAISDYYEPTTRVEEVYRSKRLSEMDLCALCGPDCIKCKSNVPSPSSRVTLSPALWVLLFVAFILFQQEL